MADAKLSSSKDQMIKSARMRIDSLLHVDPDGATFEGESNFIADIHHWCDGKGIDFEGVLTEADAAYRSDCGERPEPPARRLLALLESSRETLVEHGLPASKINDLISLVGERLKKLVVEKPVPVCASDESFEDSLRTVARDQWTDYIARLEVSQIAPEALRDLTKEKIGASGLVGAPREGAQEALKRYCDSKKIHVDFGDISTRRAVSNLVQRVRASATGRAGKGGI